MDTQNEKLTIQQVAELTGLSVHTLRYYERIGLIHPIGRAQNTHRRYSMKDVGWIDFLNKLRARACRFSRWRRIQLEAHMNELREHLKIIHYKIDYYEGVIAEAEKLPEVS